MFMNKLSAIILLLSTIYNMSGRVVSDIQTRAEGEIEFVYPIQHGRECCK